MEMCYGEALVMPSSYAVMSEEEMTYTEGGMFSTYYWWGRYDYYSHSERQNLFTALVIAGGICTIAGQMVAVATIGAISSIISEYDDGYGVKLRYTNLVGYTGIYSLREGEYSVIKC